MLFYDWWVIIAKCSEWQIKKQCSLLYQKGREYWRQTVLIKLSISLTRGDIAGVFSLCSSVFFCSYRGSSCHSDLCIFIKYDEIWCLHMSDVFSVHLKLLLLSSQYFLYWPVLFHPVLAKTCVTSLWNDSGCSVSWWISCIVGCT